LETDSSKVISISENFSSNNLIQKQVLTQTVFEIGSEPNLVKAL